MELSDTELHTVCQSRVVLNASAGAATKAVDAAAWSADDRFH
jgi:hypothetical protein